MSGPNTTVELLVKLLGLLGLSDHSNLSSSNTNASKSNFVSHDNPTVYHTSIGPGPHNYVPTAPSPGPIPYYTLPAQPQGPIALPVQYVGSAHPHVASQMVIPAQQPMYPTSPFQTFTTPASGFAGQKTTLPHAFAAGTLHDPTTDAWNMDTAVMRKQEVSRQLVITAFENWGNVTIVNEDQLVVHCSPHVLNNHSSLSNAAHRYENTDKSIIQDGYDLHIDETSLFCDRFIDGQHSVSQYLPEPLRRPYNDIYCGYEILCTSSQNQPERFCKRWRMMYHVVTFTIGSLCDICAHKKPRLS
ncbi:hypothetical protein Tco_0428897 [Tanacetum coccineum]